MTTTCRAVVFNGDDTYQIQDFRKPDPPEGGALLKVEAVGMCSSDVMQLAGHKHVPGEVAPVVAGHEIVGRVEALADGAIPFSAPVTDLTRRSADLCLGGSSPEPGA